MAWWLIHHKIPGGLGFRLLKCFPSPIDPGMEGRGRMLLRCMAAQSRWHFYWLLDRVSFALFPLTRSITYSAFVLLSHPGMMMGELERYWYAVVPIYWANTVWMLVRATNRPSFAFVFLCILVSMSTSTVLGQWMWVVCRVQWAVLY